ncbi:uncharacterized protein LOC114165219 [Vigna unguiculata]|uniref:uncharacterized protein LOC114165219 n=1 Tax=Vigna unguiculata TaxID=3917 RepID=UPI0010169E91|nr:uncharacterized protein LOC114165219 [Vigna unguiculata]
MRSRTRADNFLFDPEIERTARRNNSRRRRQSREAREATVISDPTLISSSDQEEENMAKNPHDDARGERRRTLEDYAAFTGTINFNSIARPTVNATNMEMKPALIHLVQSNQFNGLANENPYTHLATFLEICNTVKIHQVPDEAIRLSLFPFSLAGNAKVWLNSFPENSLTSWEDVVSKFLSKYFPQSKINKGKQEISAFQQDVDESLGQAWDRFKGLLRKTPIHGFDEPTQLTLFLAGLKSHSKLMLDASAGGSIKWKTPTEARELIENMASNDNEVHNERAQSQQKGVLQLQSHDALLAQNKIMTQQLEALMKKLSQLPQDLRNVSQAQHQQQLQNCELCGGDHTNGQCAMQNTSQEEVNYMGNTSRQGNYNQGWRSHPNMGQAGPSNRPPPQQFQQHPSLADRTSKIEDILNQFMQVSISNHKSTEAAIRNLEVQMGQIAKRMEEKSDTNFAANTEVNPKEHVKAITTRSGKVLEERKANRDDEKREESGELHERKEESIEEDDENVEGGHKEMGEREKNKGKSVEKPLPYPKIHSRKEKEKQFGRFLDIFKRLEINIPFSEALQQMPSYARFMKELLTKKRKYIEEETIEVQGNCSAII